MMSDIMWFERTVDRKNKADVSVKISSDERGRTVFTLRNEVWHKITHTGFVKVGVTTDRVYFAESMKGYKVTGNDRAGSRYVQIAHTLDEGWEGSFQTLHLDALKDLWFIDKKEVIK